MGMLGSEIAFEKLCHILDDLLQDSVAAKLSDNFYCTVSTPEKLLSN